MAYVTSRTNDARSEVTIVPNNATMMYFIKRWRSEVTSITKCPLYDVTKMWGKRMSCKTPLYDVTCMTTLQNGKYEEYDVTAMVEFRDNWISQIVFIFREKIIIHDNQLLSYIITDKFPLHLGRFTTIRKIKSISGIQKWNLVKKNYVH